jgi:signal transduction histidine kinase
MGRSTGILRRLRGKTASDRPDGGEERYRAALMQAMMEASADSILIVAPDRRIVSSNERFQQMWGVPSTVVDSSSDEAALASALSRVAEPEAFLAKVYYLYEHPEERSWDEVALRDGRVFERYSAPVTGPDRSSYGRVWFFRDVSARREAQRLLEKLRLEFAAAIVHDLRAPIQTILLQTSAFLRAVQGGEVRVKESAVHRIERQALHLARMTTDLLDVTTVDLNRVNLNREWLSLPELARDTIDNIRPMLGHHLVQMTAGGMLPPVRVDRHRLGRVLTNLLVNAAMYSPEESPIDVDVETRGNGVEVSVRDAGLQIPKEDIPYVFDRFFPSRQIGAVRSGFGLGLYAARAFVDAHGGHLSVESTTDKGTTFRAWLPTAAA